MLFSVEQALLGRDEIQAPLETLAWEATKQAKQKYNMQYFSISFCWSWHFVPFL